MTTVRNPRTSPITHQPQIQTVREAKRAYAEAEPVDFIYTDQHGDTKVRLKTALDNKFAFKFFALEELDALLKKAQGTPDEEDEL